jgi:hypothetical protein
MRLDPHCSKALTGTTTGEVMQPSKLTFFVALTLYAAALACPVLTTSASAQTCATTCATACGPRADFPAAVYNKCTQTCGTKCNACQLTTSPAAFAYPKFYVVGLFYSPPGCTKTATAACATQSTVDYIDGSSAGTKISSSNSFQSGVDIKVDATLGLGTDGKGGSFGLGGSFGYSTTTTDTSSESLTKSSSLEEKFAGNQDGVNHDQDTFLLLLNPAVAAKPIHTFDSNYACHITGASWSFGINTKIAPTQALYKLSVGNLKNPATMPADVAAQLKLLNFTPADYQTILAQDPLASNPLASPTTIASGRFVPTTITFPYQPPDVSTECNSGVCSCLSLQGTLKNEYAADMGTSSKSEYKVGVTQSGGINAGVFKLGESIALNYDWISTSTQDDLTGSTQSATASVQCPSIGYNGPTLMEVYWDNLYGSFVFFPAVLNASGQNTLAQGTVTGATGQILRHQPVDLAVGTKTLHTYTDSHGKYVFVAPVGMSHGTTGLLSVLGASHSVAIGSTQDIKTTSK